MIVFGNADSDHVRRFTDRTWSVGSLCSARDEFRDRIGGEIVDRGLEAGGRKMRGDGFALIAKSDESTANGH